MSFGYWKETPHLNDICVAPLLNLSQGWDPRCSILVSLWNIRFLCTTQPWCGKRMSLNLSLSWGRTSSCKLMSHGCWMLHALLQEEHHLMRRPRGSSRSLILWQGSQIPVPALPSIRRVSLGSSFLITQIVIEMSPLSASKRYCYNPWEN